MALRAQRAAGVRLSPLVSNTVVQFVNPALRIGLGLILAATLSRFLGVAGFGQYALVFAYVATFSGVLSDWGLGTICLREFSRSPQRRVSLIAGAASLQALIAVASYLVMLGSLLVVHYPPAVTVSVALYGLTVLLTPLDLLALPFQADLRLHQLLTPSVLGTLLNFGLVMGAIGLGGGLALLVAGSLLSLCVRYGWTTALSLKSLGVLVRPTSAHWRLLLGESWPLALTTAVSTLLQQAPLLALSLVSLSAVGLFNAAARIPQQLLLLPLAVRVTVFPLLSAAWVADRQRFLRQLDRLLQMSLLVSVPGAILGIGLATPLVALIFGPAFQGAAIPFALLMGVFAVLFPGILLGEALIATGYQRWSLAIQAGSLPLLLLLLAVLTPGGAAGAALSLLLSYVAIVAAVSLVAWRKLGLVSLGPSMARAVAAMGLGLLALRVGIGAGSIVASIVGAVVAMVVLTLLGNTGLRDLLRVVSVRGQPAMHPLHNSSPGERSTLIRPEPLSPTLPTREIPRPSQWWLPPGGRQSGPTGGGAMRRPKVALVYPIPFGDDGLFGGGERYAQELARAMSRRTETVLVTIGRKGRRERRDSLRVEVHPWITLVRGLRQNPLSLGFLESLRGVDVVHCLAYSTLLTDLSVLFARLTRKKAFITDVGGGADVTLARFVDVTRLAHALLLISQRASREFGGGQRSRHVIYAGIDIDRYVPGLKERQRRVLFVGRLLPHKGINDLIDAVDETIPLTIAGRPYDARHYELLKARAAGKDVTFVTDATDDDLLRLYQTCAVCVLPSVYHTVDGGYAPVPELLGFTLMEAMACATPVICTAVGSLPELVEDGVNGFVVPPNQPAALRRRIDELLADPRRAQGMGEQARQTIVKTFTWDSVVDRCLAAYQEALAW
jgi:glycosyltransferase involved in cell wall biosynthesis/O-antigen/teichoic acid export membrane protein